MTTEENEGSENKKQEDKLKFNLGVSYVQRVDYILIKIMFAREEQNIQALLMYLKSLYIEIKARMDKEELKKAEKLLNNIIKEYNAWNKIPRNRKPKISHNLDLACEEFENFLRIILHKFDLLMPKQTTYDGEGGGWA